MKLSLESKLAGYMDYIIECYRFGNEPNKTTLRTFYDDIELNNWLGEMNKQGRVPRTHFPRAR